MSTKKIMFRETYMWQEINWCSSACVKYVHTKTIEKVIFLEEAIIHLEKENMRNTDENRDIS